MLVFDDIGNLDVVLRLVVFIALYALGVVDVVVVCCVFFVFAFAGLLGLGIVCAGVC